MSPRNFGPQHGIARGGGRYLADGTAEAGPRSCRPPIRLARIAAADNMAPGGTGALMAMRRELTRIARRTGIEAARHRPPAPVRLVVQPRLPRTAPDRLADAGRGAGKLIAYEAVHEIKGWDDLRRRLAPDRRCFAFFHPALPGEPLIFVEVALVEGLATAMPPLLAPETEEARRGRSRARGHRDFLFDLELPGRPARRVVRQFPDQAGGRGAAGRVSAAAAFLHAVAGTGVPALAQQHLTTSDRDAALLGELERDGWWHDPEQSEQLRTGLDAALRGAT